VAPKEPYTPSRSAPQDGHESNSDKVIARRSFAPALEHGNHSTREQQNRAHRENLEQHKLLPQHKHARNPSPPKRTPITLPRDRTLTRTLPSQTRLL
jgi:hypothetical protein